MTRRAARRRAARWAAAGWAAARWAAARWAAARWAAARWAAARWAATRLAAALFLLAPAGCGGAESAAPPARPSPRAAPAPSAPAADLAASLAVYRDHLAAVRARDPDAFYGALADSLTCYLGEETASVEALRDAGAHEALVAIAPLALEAEPVARRAVRVRAWVYVEPRDRRPHRIEPRVARLRRGDDGWRITSEIGFEADCGFPDGLDRMEPAPTVEACLVEAARGCGWGNLGEDGAPARVACDADGGRMCESLCLRAAARACLLPTRSRSSIRGPSSWARAVAPGCSDDGWCVLAPGPSPAAPVGLEVGPDGRVWAATRGGVFVQDAEPPEGQAWTQHEGLEGSIHGLFVDADDVVAVTSRGLYHLEAGQWRRRWASPEGAYGPASRVQRAPDGSLFASGYHGRLLRFEDGAWRRAPRVDAMDVWGLVTTADGRLAFGDARPWRQVAGDLWEPADAPVEVVRAGPTLDGWRIVEGEGEGEGEGGAALVPSAGAAPIALPEPFSEVARTDSGWVGLGASGLWTWREGEWTVTAPPPGDRFSAVAARGDRVVLGSLLGVRRCEGGTCAPLDTVTRAELTDAVSVRGALHLRAAGRVLRWEGGALRDLNAPTDARSSPWMVADGDQLLVVSFDRTFVYDGEGWTEHAHGATRLNGAAASGGGRAVAYDRGYGEPTRLFRWTGREWQQSAALEDIEEIVAVLGPRRAVVRARVEYENILALHDGRRRRDLEAPTHHPVSLLPLSDGDLLLGAAAGSFRFDGRRWVPLPGGVVRFSRAVPLGGDGLLALSRQRVLRLEDDAWVEETLPGETASAIRGLHVHGDHVYAFGSDGVLLRRPLRPAR